MQVPPPQDLPMEELALGPLSVSADVQPSAAEDMVDPHKRPRRFKSLTGHVAGGKEKKWHEQNRGNDFLQNSHLIEMNYPAFTINPSRAGTSSDLQPIALAGHLCQQNQLLWLQVLETGMMKWTHHHQ